MPRSFEYSESRLIFIIFLYKKTNKIKITVLSVRIKIMSVLPMLRILPNKKDKRSGWYPGLRATKTTPKDIETGKIIPRSVSIDVWLIFFKYGIKKEIPEA